MSDGHGPPREHRVLREIAWRELFPWLLLFRTFRLAVHPLILGVALLAALLTPLGWQFARQLFQYPLPTKVALDLTRTADAPPAIEAPPADAPGAPPVTEPLATEKELHALAMSEHADELGRIPGIGRTHDPFLRQAPTLTEAVFQRSPIPYVFWRFTSPLLRVYRTETNLWGLAYYLFGTLWMLAVWGFAGGMITRMAAIELGREEQASIRGAFWLTARRWFDFFSAPLYPVLGTFLIALLAAPVGLILWSSAVGTIVAGLLWIFVLIGGALAALLLLWLFVGWPLMWPAISAEETGDSFEGMNRSFAYAFQRPLHYLFYAAVATLFGLICWSVVDFLCVLALSAAHWAVSWGSGHDALMRVLTVPLTSQDAPLSLRVGAGMIRGIEALLLALSEAFAYSFFWVAATAIYLLLRQNVDRTEFDEVWTDDQANRYPLAPVETQAAASPAPSPVPSASQPDESSLATAPTTLSPAEVETKPPVTSTPENQAE